MNKRIIPEPLCSIVAKHINDFIDYGLYKRDNGLRKYQNIVEDIYHKCELMHIFGIEFCPYKEAIVRIRGPNTFVGHSYGFIPDYFNAKISLAKYRIPIKTNIVDDTALGIQEIIIRTLLEKDSDNAYSRKTIIRDGVFNNRNFDGILRDHVWVLVGSDIADKMSKSNRFRSLKKSPLEQLVDGVFEGNPPLIRRIGHYNKHKGNGIKGRVIIRPVAVYEWPEASNRIISGCYQDQNSRDIGCSVINSLLSPASVNSANNFIKYGFETLQPDYFSVLELY